LELYATEILHACYQWTNAKDVVDKQLHLMAQQKFDLLDILKQNERLFDGSLGSWCLPSLQHIDINSDAKPVHR
jgi:hypothetical protein